MILAMGSERTTPQIVLLPVSNSSGPMRTILEMCLEAASKASLMELIGRERGITEHEAGIVSMSENNRPPHVPKSVWQKTTALDVTGLAEANKCAPGCIYLNSTMLNEIRDKTALARTAIEKKTREASLSWLCRVCVGIEPTKDRIRCPHSLKPTIQPKSGSLSISRTASVGTELDSPSNCRTFTALSING